MSGEQELVRRRARILREMAQAAEDGPWESFIEPDTGDVLTLRISDDDADPGAEVAVATSIANGSYISSVHPLVGLALADWLDYLADYLQSGNEIPALRGLGLEQGLAVARALEAALA